MRHDERKRLTVRWLLVSAIGISLFVLGFWAGAWSISSDVREAARRDVEAALALSAANADVEKLRRRFGIPAALRSKDETIVYYLLSARRVDGGRDTGANYFLALHFLKRDCARAKVYLSAQLRLDPGDQRVQRLAEAIQKDGCSSAAQAVTH